MNIDRRTFLRSSAGAIAATVLDVRPCAHSFSPQYVAGTVCTKCNATMEDIWGRRPIRHPPGTVLNVPAGHDYKPGPILMSLAAYCDLSNATKIVEPTRTSERHSWKIPVSEVKWERATTVPMPDKDLG